jgi:outer membrane receptor for ferrienterochelin and colicins
MWRVQQIAYWVVLILLSQTVLAQAIPFETPQNPSQPEIPRERNSSIVDRVEITGNALTDQDARKYSVVNKVVIGRDELDRFGDVSVKDVLRRMPGFTQNKSDISFRGLSGSYVQILVDGNRMPEGFSLASISPDQVDRIEILRAPTADLGTEAIAGTINIVLRGIGRRPETDVRAGIGYALGRPNPSMSIRREDRATNAFAYAIYALPYRSDWLERSEILKQYVYDGPAPSANYVTHQQRTNSGVRDGIQGNGTLDFRFADGSSISLLPAMSAKRKLKHEPLAALLQLKGWE